MKLFSFSTDPIVHAFGWMLLHAVWQGFAITVLAAGILFLLRRRASYGRYWTGISALFLQILVSAGTFALYYQPRALQVAMPKVTHFAQPFVTKSTQVMVSMPWYNQTLWFLQSNLDTIVLFWVIGASVLLLRLVGSWIYVQQLKAEGIRLTESRIQEMFRRIAAKLNIRSTVHLFESVRVSTPVVIGFIKPVVLLPVGLATGLTTKQIEAILAHELAHVKRFDYLVNLIQSLVEVVYFFHPALWWLSSRVRAEREHCCDDVAVQVCGDKLAFARALAEVEAFRQSPALAMAFASKKGMMLQRVKRVLGVTEKPQHRMSPNVLVLFVLLVFGVSVYAFQQDGKPKQAKAKISKMKHNSIFNITEKEGGTRIEMNQENSKLVLIKVLWEHRQLSNDEVSRLQKLRDKIELGELSINDIQNKQQKDILEYLHKWESSFDEGFKGLGKGLKQLSEFYVKLDSLDLGENNVIKELEVWSSDENLLTKIVDSVLVNGKWVAANEYEAKWNQVDNAKMAFHQRKMDSLSRMMEPQHQKMEALRLEMEQYEFKTSELERKMEVLEWKRSKFYDERSQLLEKRNRTMYHEGQKVKKSETEVEKELAQFEEQIKQQETQIQQLNQQTAELRQQIKTARQPVEDLEKQVHKLEEMNEKYAREMERYSSEMAHMLPPPPPPVERARVKTPRPVMSASPFIDAVPAKSSRVNVRAPRAVVSPRTPRAATAPTPAAPAAPKKK
ncbi:M56 family metallopeptidase [Runella sp.]|uniref:M56 family metallopeptidase n=1 Tax=Runella sp. TaxID=1960881 RepID=UPI003019FCCC